MLKPLIPLLNSMVALQADEGKPVRLEENFAIRDKSLAQGLGGVALAVGEALGGITIGQVDKNLVNIFEAEVEVDGELVSLRNPKSSFTNHESSEGDIFYGRPAKIWAQCALGLQRSPLEIDRFLPGPIEHPGLGHGELSRHLVVAISNGSGCYCATEEDLPLGGWCNGSLGQIVASSWNLCLSSSANWAEPLERFFGLLESIHDGRIEIDSSLCHGMAGVLAVGASIARLAGNLELIEVLDESWIRFSNSERFLSGRHDGTLCDYSWLTGISGIVWANAILRREPLLNPIVPWDSLLYNEGELSKEQL